MKLVKIKSFPTYVRKVTKLKGATEHDGQGHYDMYTPEANWVDLVKAATKVANKLFADNQLEREEKRIEKGEVVRMVVTAKQSAMVDTLGSYRTLIITKEWGMQVI